MIIDSITDINIERDLIRFHFRIDTIGLFGPATGDMIPITAITAAITAYIHAPHGIYAGKTIGPNTIVKSENTRQLASCLK